MQKNRARTAVVLLALGVSPCSIYAQTTAVVAHPQVIQKLLDCRQIKEDAARLACFDTQAGELVAADARGDVKIIDRSEMTKTRRALFGLNLSGVPFFGNSKSSDPRRPTVDDEIKEITGIVRSVARNADGGWILTLADGARWEQTDAVMLGRKPVPGAKVTIKRAAFGSYKMTVEDGPTMRARRLG